MPWAALPELWIHVLIVLLGLIFGSFCNVLIYRLPRGQSVVWPSSACPACGHKIKWTDNIPVISFLFLRGKCRSCSASIPLRYPVVELLTALLFLAVKVRFGLSPLLWVRDFPFCLLLVAISFIDLEHRIIPDRLSLPGILLGLMTAYWVPGLGLISGLVGAVLGFGLFYGFAWFYFRWKGRHGLGGGDVKLLAMLGAFLGPAGVFSTILISSVLGSVIGIALAVLASRKRAERAGEESSALLLQAIPYGPFLVIGGLYVYLLGDLLWLPFTIPT